MKPLRIAMLTAIKRPMQPDTTVSRLRVIADVTKELIARGHHVTLFATDDSKFPGAEIVGISPAGLNFLPIVENPFYQQTAYMTAMVAELVKRQSQFDLVHNHMYPEFLPLLVEPYLNIPMITTVHSQMIPDTVMILSKFPHAHYAAISQAAKDDSGGLPMDVVHNGIDTSLFTPRHDGEKGYLLFVGRMSKAKDENGRFLDPKGVSNAIRTAILAQERLIIVGNVEDQAFYDTLVAPYLSDRITFYGKITSEQTVSRNEIVTLFQGAKAFLNPINWKEPFGLVMAEAMACGTPVIAYNRGSVPELIRDGTTGFIVDPPEENNDTQNALLHDDVSGRWVVKQRGIEGLVEAVKRIGGIDRTACRKHAEDNFSIHHMVDGYETLYERIIHDKKSGIGPAE